MSDTRDARSITCAAQARGHCCSCLPERLTCALRDSAGKLFCCCSQECSLVGALPGKGVHLLDEFLAINFVLVFDGLGLAAEVSMHSGGEVDGIEQIKRFDDAARREFEVLVHQI